MNDNQVIAHLLLHGSKPIRHDSAIFDTIIHDNHSPPNLPVPIGFQLSWLDPYISFLLRDKRDTVFIKTSLYLGLGPISALYLILYKFTWIHFTFHALWIAKYATTYVLMLHCICHRPMYKPAYLFLNSYVYYGLSLFYGHSFESFYWHHIKMHHVEDNGPNDLSSTLLYQRDQFIHFIHYAMRFILLTTTQLPLYFFNKKWYTCALRAFLMEIGSWLCILALARLGSLVHNQAYLATLLTIIAPLILMRFGMISGNWAQHAFIDPTRMDCDYVHSLTCIDCHYNQIAFNDGYHTSHHLNPRRHWADHPSNLVMYANEYARKGTLVLKGIDFHWTWWYLMTHNYAALANAYVHLDPYTVRPTDEWIIALLKSRVMRFSPEQVRQYYGLKKKLCAGR